MRGMQTQIPTSADIRRRLQSIKRAELADLAQRAGVPFPTLVKIRNGQTQSPTVDTVRRFWPLVAEEAVSAGPMHYPRPSGSPARADTSPARDGTGFPAGCRVAPAGFF